MNEDFKKLVKDALFTIGISLNEFKIIYQEKFNEAFDWKNDSMDTFTNIMKMLFIDENTIWSYSENTYIYQKESHLNNILTAILEKVYPYKLTDEIKLYLKEFKNKEWANDRSLYSGIHLWETRINRSLKRSRLFSDNEFKVPKMSQYLSLKSNQLLAKADCLIARYKFKKEHGSLEGFFWMNRSFGEEIFCENERIYFQRISESTNSFYGLNRKMKNIKFEGNLQFWKIARENAGLTIDSVIKHLGHLNKDKIIEWENDKSSPKGEDLKKLLELYKVDIDKYVETQISRFKSEISQELSLNQKKISIE